MNDDLLATINAAIAKSAQLERGAREERLIAARELERVRKVLGLSQERLAHRAGKSFVLVNRVENGHVVPSLDTLRSLQAALAGAAAELAGTGKNQNP